MHRKMGEERHTEKKTGSGRCRERQHEILSRRKKKSGFPGSDAERKREGARDGVNNEQRGAKQHAMDL